MLLFKNAPLNLNSPYTNQIVIYWKGYIKGNFGASFWFVIKEESDD